MKKTLLFSILFIALLFSCKSGSDHEKADVSASNAAAEKKDANGVNETKSLEETSKVGAEKVKASKVEKADGKTSASEGSWEGGHVEEEEDKSPDHPVMDVFDPDFINGRWEAEDQNGYSFGTWFDSDQGIVIGQYCAMNHDASRIDCGTHEEIESCYLKSGPVKGKKMLELEIVSCYALKKGKATLTPQGDGHLIWRLVEPPGKFEVDHFAPEEALLRKVSFDPHE